MGRDDPYRSRGGDQDDPYGSSRHGATPFGADRADSRGPDQYASDRFSPDRFSSDRQDPGPHDRDRYGEPAGQPSSGVLPSGGQSNDGTGAAFGAARWGAAGARSARPRDLSDADRFGAEPSGGPFGGGPFGGGQAGARTSDHSFGGDRAGTAPEAPFGAPGRDADETAPMQRITDDTAPGPSFGGKRITDDTAPGGSFGGKGSSRTGAAGAGGDRAGTGVGPTGGRSADAAGIGAPQTGQPAGAAPDRTHRLAVAALVCGVLGLVPLGAIFGLMALSRLRKRPGAGRRLALGGLAFSAAWLAVIVGGTAVMMIFGPEGNTANPSGDNSSVSSFELAPGDCINGLKESRAVAKLPAVPCTKPHEGEVFATFALAKGGTWPGDAAVAKQAENGCVQRLEEYAPKAADDPKLEIYFLHPNDTSWKKGDREVTCVAMDPSKQRTGSLRG